MAGMSGSITPGYSGRIFVTCCGHVKNNTAGSGASIQLRRGTTAAPNNGAAIVGTAFGPPLSYDGVGWGANQQTPFSVSALVTGLLVGTAYWLDVSLATINGGTATIAGTSICAHEF
jgi:hypothetical protein